MINVVMEETIICGDYMVVAITITTTTTTIGSKLSADSVLFRFPTIYSHFWRRRSWQASGELVEIVYGALISKIYTKHLAEFIFGVWAVVFGCICRFMLRSTMVS